MSRCIEARVSSSVSLAFQVAAGSTAALWCTNCDFDSAHPHFQIESGAEVRVGEGGELKFGALSSRDGQSPEIKPPASVEKGADVFGLNLEGKILFQGSTGGLSLYGCHVTQAAGAILTLPTAVDWVMVQSYLRLTVSSLTLGTGSSVQTRWSEIQLDSGNGGKLILEDATISVAAVPHTSPSLDQTEVLSRLPLVEMRGNSEIHGLPVTEVVPGSASTTGFTGLQQHSLFLEGIEITGDHAAFSGLLWLGEGGLQAVFTPPFGIPEEEEDDFDEIIFGAGITLDACRLILSGASCLENSELMGVKVNLDGSEIRLLNEDGQPAIGSDFPGLRLERSMVDVERIERFLLWDGKTTEDFDPSNDLIPGIHVHRNAGLRLQGPEVRIRSRAVNMDVPWGHPGGPAWPLNVGDIHVLPSGALHWSCTHPGIPSGERNVGAWITNAGILHFDCPGLEWNADSRLSNLADLLLSGTFLHRGGLDTLPRSQILFHGDAVLDASAAVPSAGSPWYLAGTIGAVNPSLGLQSFIHLPQDPVEPLFAESPFFQNWVACESSSPMEFSTLQESNQFSQTEDELQGSWILVSETVDISDIEPRPPLSDRPQPCQPLSNSKLMDRHSSVIFLSFLSCSVLNPRRLDCS